MEAILAIMASSIRFSIPYTLAGLGGTYSERSGVVNIGLEGMMLTGAFTAVAVANATGSAWLGLLAAIFAGMLLGLIHGVSASPSKPIRSSADWPSLSSQRALRYSLPGCYITKPRLRPKSICGSLYCMISRRSKSCSVKSRR